MAATLPNTLPLQISSFVGREPELAEVKHLLAASRLVTLTGAGGCGKTRLALQVGRDVPSERLYEHGVWFVTLAALADPALVPHAVASGFGVREPPNQLLLATLTSFLRDKYLLLILDNCEHLIDECAQLVASLLQACAHLTILATSREPLNIDGEKVYLVPSLPVPGAESRVLSAEAQHSEAVQLFVARAQAVNASFALSAQNAQVVSRICQQLDGIPLAIELAAARTNVLSAAEIAARLSNSLALLTSGNRTALPRHQTMRAALDWSYELLNEPERALFRRLSVFAGGCTLEAVEFVCADELPQLSPRRGEGARTLLSLAGRGVGGEGGCDVLDMLARLVSKSLVLAEERPSTSARQAGETRYRLLEPVRQYAWQALQQAAEAEHLRARHLAYFCQFANEAEQQLRSADAIAWLNRLEIEQPNLRAATEWALASGTVSAGLSIGGALTWFCWFKGYWQEWRERLSELLAHAAARQSSVHTGQSRGAAHRTQPDAFLF